MAEIRLVRVDSRLGHGKTIREILKNYDLEKVIFANDKLSEDEIRREVVGLTVPDEADANFLKVSEVKNFLEKNTGDYFLIVQNTEDLEKIIDEGNEIEEINIGIIHMSFGKKSLTEMVAADDEDLRIFRKLSDLGLDVYIRKEITDHKRPIEDFLRK